MVAGAYQVPSAGAGPDASAAARAARVGIAGDGHGSTKPSSRRRSIATYEPGWDLATVFISEAAAMTSRGSRNGRLVDRPTPIEMVTSWARLTSPRRSTISR